MSESEAARDDSAAATAVGDPRRVLLSRPALAALGAVTLAALVELVPTLAPLRVFSARPASSAEATPAASPSAELVVGESEISTVSEGRSELAPGSAVSPGAGTQAPLPAELSNLDPKLKLEDGDGKTLNAFFSALTHTRSKTPGAITRIVHFGDSIVASDYVSGTLRRRFQERFGDAGHGFSLIANAWPAYFHNDIERYATAGWKVSRVVGPLADDGMYGLGCVSFRAEKNVLARFSTAKKGDFGTRASRFSVSYLESPEAGSFQVSVDGEVRAEVDTRAPQKRAASYELRVPDGPHSFEILTKRGISRLFGAVLERDGPGVVLDAIGIQGARIRFLDKQDDAHWAEQLQARKPDLLIYEFGANESADGLLYPMADYFRTMKDVLAQGKLALPGASCLVIGAMDRASKKGEELKSLGIIPLLVAEQRRAANEVGCAFFDTFTAMGGPGSMPRWVRRGLGQADLTHPSAEGSDMIGTWIFRALMQRYGEFLSVPSSAGSGSPNTEAAKSSPNLR
ncbi:MAG TPA: GDSL-type esterase/lipase family protein [Polyangiaceae bacterium]|nr:GDSL-type esterase/lipase family protein [Polyangiaceae bacterium]